MPTNINSKLKTQNSKLVLLLLLLLVGCDASGNSATPTPDPALVGKIAFVETNDDGSLDLFALNANGSGLVRLTSGLKVQGVPKWSPDGGSILFTAQPTGKQQVYIYRLGSGSKPTNLSNNSYDETFANWSPDGTRIICASNRTGGYQVYTMKPDGSDVQPLTLSQQYGVSSWPAYSPDGKQVAYVAGDTVDKTELYVINADGTNARKLTSYNSLVAQPTWSPDGSKIVFTYQRGAAEQTRYNIYIINADGSSQRALTNGDTIDRGATWSPDGKRIAFYSNQGGGAVSDAYTIAPDATGLARLTSGGGLYPAYSPDGRFIVVARVPKPGASRQLFIHDADGSNLRQLTFDKAEHSFPTWGR